MVVQCSALLILLTIVHRKPALSVQNNQLYDRLYSLRKAYVALGEIAGCETSMSQNFTVGSIVHTEYPAIGKTMKIAK